MRPLLAADPSRGRGGNIAAPAVCTGQARQQANLQRYERADGTCMQGRGYQVN